MTVRPAYYHSVHPAEWDADCPDCTGDSDDWFAGNVGRTHSLPDFAAGLCAGVLLLALALLLARAVWP